MSEGRMMKPQDLTLGSECLGRTRASGLLLNLSSDVLSVYPWFLRLSLILYRLVQ